MPRFGTVSSVDPGTATARVTLQPEGVLSGWLPLLTPWGRKRMGDWCARPHQVTKCWCSRKRATLNKD